MASLLKYACVAGACAMIALILAGPIRAQEEPSMATYTHYPIFQTETVDPRIMIVLDNSGSMNFPAYGNQLPSWPKGGTLTGTFAGNMCQEYSGRVSAGFDDGMEQKNTGQIYLCNNISTLTMLDLDLGKDDDIYQNSTPGEWQWKCNRRGRNCRWRWVDGSYTTCASQEAVLSAMRFTNVTVPREVDGVPVTVANAYINFTARNNNGGNSFRKAALTLKITAEAADNPVTLGTADYNISSRADTTASVTWDIPYGAWSTGSTYSTPDLTALVQEIVSRPGWNAGQAILFKIDWVSGNGGRVTYSFDGNQNWAPQLVIEYEPCEISNYYGYFNPEGRYTYSNDRFIPNSSGDWDGSFLNFLCMRRGDILKKAVVGGRTEAISGSTNVALRGATDDRSYLCEFRRHHTGAGVSPWADAWYTMDSGNIHVGTESNSSSLGSFVIRVEKDPALDSFSEFGPDRLPGGVMQKVGDRAAWGNAWFTSSGDGNSEIDEPIGTDMSSIISGIRSKPFSTSTPLAESLYVVMQYFKQQKPEISGYASDAIGTIDTVNDPYFDTTGTMEEACAKGYVLLLTDGMSTNDQQIPSYLKDYAGLGIQSFDSSGTSYARDVAFYMNTNDLRSGTVGKDQLAGVQNIGVYVINALNDDPQAADLLQDVAKYGGFRENCSNDDEDEEPCPEPWPWPDLQNEWDKDGNGIADNYFEAKDGTQLEQQLMSAVLAIIEQAGSGTAVSVLATKGEGEGTLVQAIFDPTTSTAYGNVTWRGYLHSLWVDDHGLIREDTINDYTLDTDQDKRIIFGREQECDEEGECEDTGETVFWTYTNESVKGPTEELDVLRPIWAAGGKLAEREPLSRKIFTYTGDGTEPDPDLNFAVLNDGGDFTNVLNYSNFLGVKNSAAWGYLGSFEIARAINLVLWTLGVPDNDAQYWGAVNLRQRTLTDGRLWKLGDIIQSTPTSLAQPLADYDLLYSDESYYEYYQTYKNRETVVFVGSNDGMLHAFTGWVYSDGSFVNPYEITDYFLTHTDSIAGDVDIGEELWAYIPQNILPHLKWMADPNYTHVNTIDLRPRIFDAKIFDNSTVHINGWGTVLVCGFGFAGGMEIPVNPNHPDTTKRTTMYPSFFAFDITEPRSPVFLWERNFPDMGMSSNYPNLMKVEDNWMLAIGSGPTSMTGDSTNSASLILVDLKTGGNTAQGGLKKIFTLPGGDAFTNTPVAFDKSMNYNTDSVYVAANYNDKTSEVFRLTIPQKDSTEFKSWGTDGSSPEYISDPASSSWTITKLLQSPRPISASITLSVDRKDNAWLYLGTGRYLANTDKTNTDQNYLIGIKDPFFNPDLPDCNFSYPAVECEINKLSSEENPINDMFDADAYSVSGELEVEGPEGETTFTAMVTESRRNVYQGWFRNLIAETGLPSERVVNKGAVLGGILLMPTFMPDTDPCRAGGTSRLFAVYYETGTAFFRKIFDQDDGEGPIMDVVDLGDGIASSLSMHSGRQSGGKVYVQKSTGEILEIDIDPAFNIKSGPEYWLDDGYY